jgi:hypothetical protein
MDVHGSSASPLIPGLVCDNVLVTQYVLRLSSCTHDLFLYSTDLLNQHGKTTRSLLGQASKWHDKGFISHMIIANRKPLDEVFKR